MRHENKNILMILLILALFLSCTSCSKDNDGASEAISTESSTEDQETEKIKYIYKTKYVDIEFATDEQKREWRSALVSLLNNEKTPIYEKGEGLVGLRLLCNLLYIIRFSMPSIIMEEHWCKIRLLIRMKVM